MSLPILKVTSAPTTETLIRYFHQTESKWTEHMSESIQLDFGTAWCNPALNRVLNANRLLDVALPPGTSPENALAEATEHYASRGSTCWQWVMNPSAAEEQTKPMAEYLLGQGYTKFPHEIMYLDHISTLISGSVDDLKIIPARASFKHTRQLHEEAAKRWNEPQLADAAMMHLDDPHYDALVAIRDGAAAATIGVLAVGEIGRIDDVFVSEPLRRRGIGTAMMSRALEICARSLFKHVLLGVLPDNAAAIQLYKRFGFRSLGQGVAYQKPA